MGQGVKGQYDDRGRAFAAPLGRKADGKFLLSSSGRRADTQQCWLAVMA